MQRKAFTVIEVLMAIGIIVVLAGLSVPTADIFLSRNELHTEALKMTDALRRARNQAMSGQEDSAWGVHFTAGDYTVFKGASYNPSDSYNETFNLPGILSISAITINGGGSEIIFDRIAGTTSTFGTTTIQTDTSESQTIVVNSGGVINLQ